MIGNTKTYSAKFIKCQNTAKYLSICTRCWFVKKMLANLLDPVFRPFPSDEVKVRKKSYVPHCAIMSQMKDRHLSHT